MAINLILLNFTVVFSNIHYNITQHTTEIDLILLNIALVLKMLNIMLHNTQWV
jgi:hypothetical protein